MPSLEQIRQYLVTVVVPVLAGALGNWIVIHLHFLAAFHISAGSVAAAVSQIVVFGLTALFAFLAAHHILKGTYKS